MCPGLQVFSTNTRTNLHCNHVVCCLFSRSLIETRWPVVKLTAQNMLQENPNVTFINNTTGRILRRSWHATTFVECSLRYLLTQNEHANDNDDAKPCRLIKLEMDTPVANALVKLAQRGKKPSVEQLASVDSILDAIRSSTVWDDFVDRIKSSNVRNAGYCQLAFTE